MPVAVKESVRIKGVGADNVIRFGEFEVDVASELKVKTSVCTSPPVPSSPVSQDSKPEISSPAAPVADQPQPKAVKKKTIKKKTSPSPTNLAANSVNQRGSTPPLTPPSPSAVPLPFQPEMYPYPAPGHITLQTMPPMAMYYPPYPAYGMHPPGFFPAPFMQPYPMPQRPKPGSPKGPANTSKPQRKSPTQETKK